MRTISSSIMAALVVVALFWGNCFSCPQVLLAIKSHQPAHTCCHHSKQAPQSCQSQVLSHFVKADSSTHAPALPVTANIEEPAPAIALLVEHPFIPVEHAQPGGLLSLRI